MAKYRKKPVTVDAEQFFVDKKPWPDGVTDDDIPEGEEYRLLCGFIIFDGYWVITEEDGHRHYEEPDIFEQTYEVVE